MYFDPGMGSLIIQAIIAVLAVWGGYLVAAKKKFKNLFDKKDGKTLDKDMEDEDDDAL